MLLRLDGGGGPVAFGKLRGGRGVFSPVLLVWSEELFGFGVMGGEGVFGGVGRGEVLIAFE